jgi:hypothetical protein
MSEAREPPDFDPEYSEEPRLGDAFESIDESDLCDQPKNEI